MYKNSQLPAKERAADLLSKMTTDEKLDQMVFFHRLSQLAEDISANAPLPDYCGVFGNVSTLNDPQAVNKIQDHFLKETRLGIPLLMAFEALHGLFDKNATVFPQCAGLGGSFDRDLIYQMARTIGSESRAMGIRQVFAPNIDIPRDPRWGRTQEAYGEDPYLVGEMGVQYVKGVQEEGVAATAKHFIAYGIPENGINLAPTHMGEREMREVLLEPFEKCIEAGVMSVMPSYNEVDGEPVHASKKLLRELLRSELGFDGTVISDWGALNMLHTFQHTAPDLLTAGKMGIEAGVDIEAPIPKGYCEDFRQAVKNGQIDEKLIDEAVLRILELKFRLGLFENPYPDEIQKTQMHNRQAIDLALKMDEESILLLENDGLLPLDEKKVGTVAVIGNNAKNSFVGNYIAPTENCVSFYDGMVERLGQNRVLYAKGCSHLTCTDEMIAEAIDKAKQADVVFLVLGDSTDTGGDIGGGNFKNAEITCGEGYDTHDLNFPPSQKRLFDEILRLNKPTLLVLYAGRPYTIKNEAEKVNAFMFSWGGGEQSGIAFANLIFGDKSPSAKLSFSFPQTTGHLPCYYNHKASARGSFYKRPGTPEQPGRDYVSASPKAWYPFGYGLSYTTVEYSDLQAEVLPDGKVSVQVNVENTGNYPIYESVLLFVKMMYCPVTPFIKKLRKFHKVMLMPGEKKAVRFLLTDEDFIYIDANMKKAKNTGHHKILVGDRECDLYL